MVLPNLTDLRNVVSRLGHLAENIRISANQVSLCVWRFLRCVMRERGTQRGGMMMGKMEGSG